MYLAGPITGLTYDESTDWRSAVARDLKDAGIDSYSPLRCQNYLQGFGPLVDQYHDIHPLVSKQGLTDRDRHDVIARDLVFVNFIGAERVSIGTVIEIGWADMLRKPIVIAIEEDNVHRHAMIDAITAFVSPTLEGAVDIVKAVLLP